MNDTQDSQQAHGEAKAVWIDIEVIRADGRRRC